MKTSSINFQRRAALAWSLALPFGWLLGWASGAAIGYSVPELFTLNRDFLTGGHQLSQQIAASDGGMLGGVIGFIIGWIVATAITISSIRSIVPALKSFQGALIFLGWVLLPLVLLLAYYFLNGGL